MKKEFGRVGLTVIIGYLVIIVLAAFSFLSIYAMVETIAAEEDINSVPRKKIYLVTHTQALLNESESIGQLLNMEEGDYGHFERTLQMAHDNMDSLRVLVEEDEEMLQKIDTIDILIERKRKNTDKLLEIWKQARVDLYAKKIEKALGEQIEKVQEQAYQEKVVTKEDSVIVTAKRRSFLGRLKEVFVPTEKDSSIVVSRNEELLRDTVLNAYDPNEAIAKTLKDIQRSVSSEKQRLRSLLVDQSTKLRYDNSLINTKINQILRLMEEEELDSSLLRLLKRQDLLGETSYLITGIALISIFIIVFFLILIWRDLFKSRFYRKKLEQVVESREKLILTISHDVRAPLSSIIGYIELMQRSQPTEQQRLYLQNMGSSSKHILSLVNDLLDYQRLEAGEMELHQLPFHVSALFREIADSFQPYATAKGLEFKLDIQDDPGKVYCGDTVRIRQVVTNLLNNALKFTDQGRVELIVDGSSLTDMPGDPKKSKHSNLRIAVRDSGPGIPKAQQEMIFREFTRLSGTEKKEGFGLGLSITNRLVKLLRGKMELRSEEGNGSEFIVTIPLSLADNQELVIPETGKDEKADVDVFADGEISCLIVDDDLLQIALLEEILKLNNIRVFSTANPRNVMDFLRKEKIDMVISDVNMPGMDGIELVEQIRTSDLPHAQSLPVIVISGSVGNELPNLKESGFTDVLAKPFTSEQLIDLFVRIFPEKKRIKLKQSFVKTPKDTTLSSDNKINFSGLTAFAAGDKEASDVILKTFFMETGKHIEALKEMLETTDRAQTKEIAHKLIPIFTMLESDILVQQLKILEMNGPELTDSGWKRLVTEVIRQASSIVELEKDM